MPPLPQPLLRLLLCVAAFLSLHLALPAQTQEEQSAEAPAAPTSESCLECHSDKTLTTRRAGKEVSLFVDASHLDGSPHAILSCVDCHAGYDPEQQPHVSKPAPVDCSSCHEGMAKTHSFHSAFLKKQATPATDCKACHGSHAIAEKKAANSPFKRENQVQSCGQCHAEAKAAFLKSAHATKGASPFSGAPSCLTCHSKAIARPAGTPPTTEQKLAQVALCESCHVKSREIAQKTALGAGFVSSFNQSVHGAALLAGKVEAPACSDCHGNHDTRQAIEQGSSVSRRQVATACAHCHKEQSDEYLGSIHAAALAKGVSDAPTCTNCHGEHDIKSHQDPSSNIHAKNVSQQVCASCHASVKLAKKYGLSSDRFTTFSDSYHGLAVRGGSVEVVNCASCHGAHEIKSQNDPTSNINKANLVQTCGNCHPGASTGFTIGNVHASGSQVEQEPILYWVSTLYLILIFVTVGGMALHNLLDFIKKARRKLLIQKGMIVEHYVEHRLYLRMTVHERLQHAVLVISFVLLVLTGFMLRYPEAWWVNAIQHLSARAFEWRGIVHRIAGVVMLLGGIWHCSYLAFTEPGRKLLWDLLPRWRDLTDPYKVVCYNLGLSPDKPKFGRFCYIEKAEYWALVWGTLLMGATGAILWFDNTSMGLLTKLGFDIARTIHFYEAILATLAIIVWHFYFVIFNPDVYPMNLSWLTGRMSEKEMLEEHPQELLRIKTEEARALAAPPRASLEIDKSAADPKSGDPTPPSAQ